MGTEKAKKRPHKQMLEEDLTNAEDRMEECWQRGKVHTYYDAKLIQKEVEEVESFRPKQIITAIELSQPLHTSVPQNNLKFLSNGLIYMQNYYSFLYLKEIDLYLNFPITFYNFPTTLYKVIPYKFNSYLTVHDFISLNNFENSNNFITDSIVNMYCMLLITSYKLEDVLTVRC